MSKISAPLPTLFLPHGGGPCFFMDDPDGMWTRMADFLRGVITGLPERPRALLVVSGHWEEPIFKVTGHAQPPLIYDYGGFPPHTYALTWPAPGAPDLAADIVQRLHAAGIEAAVDATRGWDHGVFIPLKVALPDADIPVVQLSLRDDMDPAKLLAAGAALQSLREQGVLIVGSGMSYHNMRGFFGRVSAGPESKAFDDWLTRAVEAAPDKRNALLVDWARAPHARDAHPREEHLLPLMLVAGAAGDDAGHRIFSDVVMNATVSAYQFG